MKSKLFIIVALTVALCTESCILQGSKSKNEAAPNTAADNVSVPEWEGVYSGCLPCADCSGIETSLHLKSSGSYILRSRYIDEPDSVFESQGNFVWNKDEGIITLEGADEPNKYMVGEGVIFCLNENGERITGELEENYILRKVDSNLVEKYWKLTEINGNPVNWEGNGVRSPHLTFKVDGNRVEGNGGCNSFSGTYEVKTGNRIAFSKMAQTQMACINMEVETAMLKVLETADNYVITDNGTKLALNRARMAPLAVFEVAVAE